MGQPQNERKPKKDTNVLVVSGRLTRDVKQHGSMATFGLAVHKIRSVTGEWKEVAFFLDVKVFGNAAKNSLKYLEKGRPVLLTGSLDIEEYQLKLGGEVVYYDEETKRPVMMKSPVVLTDDVQFLNG
jgi:single-stranded DNA-binding protein